MCRMQVKDPCCVLCNQGVETFAHIFLCCPVAKALWFSVCWGFRSDKFPLATLIDIINLILNPPEALCQAQEQWLFSLCLAFTLEEIWRIRNVVLHLKGSVDLPPSIHGIQAKLSECYNIFSYQEYPPSPPQAPRSTSWSTPPSGTLKLNFDVAISGSKSAIAVIAKNSQGNVIHV